jgi:hypothetical protein
MRRMCAVHARRGTAYDVGLGFYAFIRFHVDTTKYRRWGADPNVASCPAIIRPTDVATVALPAQTPPVATTTTTTSIPVPALDPLAPVIATQPPVYGPVLTTPPTTETQPQQR